MSKPSSTIALTLLPTQTIVRDLGLIIGGAAMTALFAQIRIETYPVPITLQTLAVMLVGLSLGTRLGFLSQIAYLGAGLMGAPVFAGLASGSAQFLGPTGGYLVAFIPTVALLGWMSDRGWTKSAWGSALALGVGSMLTLGLGTLWLSHLIGLPKAFDAGFKPFVGIEALKAALAIPVIPAAWLVLGRRK